jgi:multiple sugar transport system ATP-binding protein
VAGFRPDHFDLGDGGPATATIRGRADVVEYLGAQELLHVSAAGKDLVAIVDAENKVQPGQDLTLRLPLDKLHVFDIETGLSLDVLAAAASA